MVSHPYRSKRARVNTRNDFDSPWKIILEHYFPQFMQFCFPQTAKEIDWKKGYVFLENEMKKISKDAKNTFQRLDKLVQVYRFNGKEIWMAIHIEIQCQNDKEFELRMFTYNYRGYDFFKKPIVSIAILGDGQSNWRPEKYEHELWGCETLFKFPTIKILDYEKREKELEESDNIFSHVVLAHLAALKAKKIKDMDRLVQTKMNLTRRLYKKGLNKEEIINLYTFIDWIITLPKEYNLKYHEEIEKMEEETKMRYITTAERVGYQRGMEESKRHITTAERIGYQRGIEDGEKRGVEQGKNEGRNEGRVEGQIEILLMQLEKKFKTVPEQYRSLIKTADEACLSEWCERIFDAQSFAELFGTVT